MPNLFSLLPSLRDVEHPLLADQRVTLVGVSAVLYDEEAYYFEVKRPRFWARREEGTISVGVGGIGGKVEAGEGMMDGLQREIQEEVNTGFRPRPSARTALLHEWEIAAHLDLSADPNAPPPYLVILLPPMLGGVGMPDHVAIASFLGHPVDRPRRGDLFGLMRVARPALETFLARPDWPLEEALDHPDLTLDLTAELPKGCLLRPVLTARALGMLIRQGIHQEAAGE